MENASKALLMAAGVLIGILVLTLAVYLFTSFGSRVKETYDTVQQQQILQYNAQYSIYEGRDDITIYDIVSVANLALDNNNEKYAGIDEYQVKVYLGSRLLNNENDIKDLLTGSNNYTDVEILNGKIEFKHKFICKKITYNNLNGRVDFIKFIEV